MEGLSGGADCRSRAEGLSGRVGWRSRVEGLSGGRVEEQGGGVEWNGGID